MSVNPGTPATVGSTVPEPVISGTPKPGAPVATVPAGQSDRGLSGVVFLDANNDGIRQPSETPMVGATVTVLLPDGSKVEAVTDNEGRYTTAPVPFGDHPVSVRNVGSSIMVNRTVRVAGAVVDLDIPLRQTSTPAPADLPLGYTGAETTRLFELALLMILGGLAMMSAAKARRRRSRRSEAL